MLISWRGSAGNWRPEDHYHLQLLAKARAKAWDLEGESLGLYSWVINFPFQLSTGRYKYPSHKINFNMCECESLSNIIIRIIILIYRINTTIIIIRCFCYSVLMMLLNCPKCNQNPSQSFLLEMWAHSCSHGPEVAQSLKVALSDGRDQLWVMSYNLIYDSES